MSFIRLTLVAILSLAAIMLPLIGLFKAPWYILLLVLAVGFTITHFAIASPETAKPASPLSVIQSELSTFASTSDLASAQSPLDQASRLTYRGANYTPVSLPTEPEEPGNENLSGKYRGCEWNHPISSSNEPGSEASAPEPSAAVRMYRGVKISPS